ncbi:putative Ig domain-containing protein [Melittangium boletus]|uniref:putative Ig domain-containing protein n=1 Tax=Melittangium boletus TaxID=83453 RepID=UPI003DA567E6
MFARLLRMLGVLVLLGGCLGEGTSTPSHVLALPDLAPQETSVGVPFEVSLGATQGTPPLQYGVGELPPGFSFYRSTGLLKGPATAEGAYAISVQVKDATGATATRTYLLQVYAVPGIRLGTVAAATQGTTYRLAFEADGGKPPLRWELAAGAPPPGLTLDADGQLRGTPTVSGTYAFTVRVRDAHGAQSERAFGMEVRAGTGEEPDTGTTPLELKVVNWNIEWFGHPSEGPTNEALQLANVRQVIKTTDADIWGLQEVVDTAHFNSLKQQLPGYDGFLSNDPSVPSGTYYYYDELAPKLALLFRSDVVRVLERKLILTQRSYDFGSRPPLQVKLRITRDGKATELTVIVLHMKAFADSESYNRRKSAAVALKSHLDALPPTTPVLVLGDWNDDVDVSILRDTSTGSYQPTPYQNFVQDSADYTFLTRPLSLARQTSTVKASNTEFIDHQLATRALATSYVNNSAQVLHPEAYIDRYGVTTTDHYPILSRFAFGPAAQTP